MLSSYDCHGPAGSAIAVEIESKIFGDAPPVFRLATLCELPVVPTPAIGGVRAYRRSDSGTVEIVAQRAHPGFESAFDSALADFVRKVVAREDERDFSDSVGRSIFEWPELFRTSIPLPGGQNIPVVGPGGNVRIHQIADGLQIDVVVRRRGAAIPSIWRNTGSIVDELFRGFGIDGADIDSRDIALKFGYFELSKYEAQTILRPALVAILDMPQDKTGVAFRSVSVAAATDTPSEIVEGLGGWSS